MNAVLFYGFHCRGSHCNHYDVLVKVILQWFFQVIGFRYLEEVTGGGWASKCYCINKALADIFYEFDHLLFIRRYILETHHFKNSRSTLLKLKGVSVCRGLDDL